MREHGTLHIPDVRAQNDFPMLGSAGAGAPSWPFPFVSRGNSLDVLNARRTEVRPFTPAQIKLLETFADQAVIAIENVRLFKELKERNGSELGAADGDERDSWASSPARRRIFSRCWMPSPKMPRGLCDANDALIFESTAISFKRVANYGPHARVSAE